MDDGIKTLYHGLKSSSAASLVPLLIRLSLYKRGLEDAQSGKDDLGLGGSEVLPFPDKPKVI